MFKDQDLHKLYSYAYSLTNGSEQAYDLVHETILNMRKKFVLNKMAYAKKSIRNKFFDQYKKERRNTDLDEKSLVEEVDWEEVTLKKDEIEFYLKDLSPGERELLYLLFVDEYTYKEIAEIQNNPLGTVLARAHRLKKVLKNKEVK